MINLSGYDEQKLASKEFKWPNVKQFSGGNERIASYYRQKLADYLQQHQQYFNKYGYTIQPYIDS